MEKKKVKRSATERIAEIDKRIKDHEDAIQKLRDKKEAVLNPKPRKRPASVRSVIEAAKAQGMGAEEILKKLGLG